MRVPTAYLPRSAKSLYLAGALVGSTVLPLAAADPGTGGTAPADLPLLLVDGTIPRPFVVAMDEIFVLDKLAGKSRFDTIPKQGSFADLSRLIEAGDGGDQDMRMIVYRQGQERTVANRRIISKAVMVKMREEHRTMEAVTAVADNSGLVVGRGHLTTNGWMVLRTTSSMESLAKAGEVSAHPWVEKAYPALGSTVRALGCDTSLRPLELNDPLFPDQWYYDPLEVNVNTLPVWLGGEGLARPYTGRTVRIAIADNGLEIQHEDLEPNVSRSLSRNFVSGGRDPSPGAGEDHGTWVGGIAGARGGNNIGIIGAAPECDLIGYRFDFEANFEDIIPDLFDEGASSVPIMNHSWGSEAYFIESEASLDELEQNVLRRNRMFVFAAGSAGDMGENANYTQFQNSKYTIAVGAIARTGLSAPYTTPGAPVVISAASGIEDTQALSLTTTDIGSPYNLYVNSGVDGTSFSAPMVSGIIGLMLEARPDLGWRDIQYIMALSGNRFFGGPYVGPTIHPHSYNNGWGMIDATAAVQLAETWAPLPDGESYRTTRVSMPVGTADGRFVNPGGDNLGGWKTFDFDLNRSPHPNLSVEHAEVRVEWRDGSVDIPQDVILISPNGFYDAPPYLSTSTSVLSRAPISGNDAAFAAPQDWTYSTVRHWDERAGRGYMRGVWRVRMRIRHFGTLPDERQLRRLTLTLSGNEVNFPPAVLTAETTSSANPGVIDPPTALENEDLVVSNIVLRDIDYDVNSLAYQWQVRGADQEDWLDVPGQGGLITDICSYAGPKAEFDVDEWPGIVDDSVTFLDFSKGGCSNIVEWLWDFDGDGVTDSTEQNPSFTYTVAGTYPVTLMVIDENGAAEGTEKLLSVLDDADDFDGTLPEFRFRDETIAGIDGIDGTNAYTGPDFVLPASFTVAGSSYRLRLEPGDQQRGGTLFFTPPVFVEALPPGLACHGEPYEFKAKLPVSTVPPDEVPPYVLVNEFSQGTLPHPANGEWVEFFTTVEVDLRNYKISNSHVTFDVELAPIPFWRAIPAGTLIVVYNGDFRDAVLPPDDLDPTDGTLVINSNSEFCVLPSNGDGWGEYPNFFPAFVGLLNPQCVPIHGVSWNRSTAFPAQITPDIHGLPAENISQMEGAHVEDAVDLEEDFDDPAFWQYNSAFITPPDPAVPGSTPAMANSAVNAATIASTLTLNGGTYYSAIPRYSYAPSVPGLTIDEETGVLSGIPNLPEGGVFDITVTRSLSWDSNSQTFTLTVKPAADDADEDRDGALNLIERAMGMDLSVPDPEKLPTVSLIPVGGLDYLGIAFRRLTGGFIDTDPASPSFGSYVISLVDSELHYAVWCSTDLVNWTNESAAGGLVQVSLVPSPDAPGVAVVTFRLADDITITGALKYLQVRVTRVPIP